MVFVPELNASLEDQRTLFGPMFIGSNQVDPGYGASLEKSLLNALLLVCAAPFGIFLILTIMAILWLFDGGPIFFGHDRIGKDGRRFKCLKFRTMVPDAEQRLQAVLDHDDDLRQEWEHTRKLSVDPRLSRFGAFMRKSSLDELPQLFNVMRGEMTLIGPRPVVAEELELYGRYAAHYKSVRPGITGLWQISGRSNLAYRRRIAMDVLYVKNASLLTDLAILIKTPLIVLTTRGAV